MPAHNDLESTMKLRRRVRLDARLDEQRVTRLKKGPSKRKARDRQAQRMIAHLRAKQNDANACSPAVQSWLARVTGKPAAKLSAEDIAQVIGD